MRAKKGLITGLVVILIALFFFGLMGLLLSMAHEKLSDSFDDMQATGTFSNETRQDIDNSIAILLWPDKIFAWLFIALVIGYLFTSFTLPPEEPVYFLAYASLLVVVTILAMIFSNAWYYIIGIPEFAIAQANLTFTSSIMRIFPLITIVVGVLGAIIFYSRTKTTGPTGGVYE